MLFRLLHSPVSQDRLIVRIMSGDEYFLVFRGFQRQHITLILQQDDGLPCPFQCRFLMFRVEYGFIFLLQVDKRILEQSEPELGFQYFGYSGIYLLFGDASFMYTLDDGFVKLRPVHMHPHSRVYTYPISVFQRLRHAVIVVHTLNVHPVADYEPVKLPLVAQHFRHQIFASVTRNPVQLIMSRHYRKHPCFQAILERWKKYLLQRSFRQFGRRAVDSVGRLAAAYKMFCAGDNLIISREILRLKSAYGSRSHLSNQIRVFSECLAHTSPTGVTGNFHVRGERPVHTACPHFDSRLTRHPFNERRVERGGLSDRSGVNG